MTFDRYNRAIVTADQEITPTPSTEVAYTPSTVLVASPPRRPQPAPRWSRRRGVLAVFASIAALGFVAAYVGPTGAAIAEAEAESTSLYASAAAQVQTYAPVIEVEPVALDRESYSVYVTPTPTPEPEPVVASTSTSSSGSGWSPPFVSPDPGSAQAIAYDMVKARGWGDGEFSCLVALWNKESGWRVNAYNASSGAYGIPQSLPGDKMASAGADWQTNPATQITWGLGYIQGRYGTPCGAWGHSQATGWY